MSSKQLGSIKTSQLYCPQHINQPVNQVTQGREWENTEKILKECKDGWMVQLQNSQRKTEDSRLHEVFLRTKCVIRAAAVVISDTNECTISAGIKVPANEALFIINEHKLWHNPVDFPRQGEQRRPAQDE